MGKRMREAIKRYDDIQQKNLIGGGIKHIERQHGRGKLTARERIDILADPGSFNELGSFVGTTSKRIDGRIPEAPCDGAVIGTARVNGRPAHRQIRHTLGNVGQMGDSDGQPAGFLRGPIGL